MSAYPNGHDMLRTLAVLIVAVALGAGCGGGGGNNPAAPPGPPAGSIAEAEPNDVVPQALGSIDSTGRLVAGTASGQNDVDLYSVSLPASGNVFMSLSWSGTQDLEVGVTDVNGVVIRNQDTPTANPEECTVTGRAAGTYIVRVGSRSGSAVSYLLTIADR